MSIENENIEPQDDGPDSAEMAADLKELQRMAAADPGAQPDPEEVAAELARPTLDTEIAGALLMMSKMLAPMFPTIGQVYTEESCAAVGAAVAPVCDKHGWLQGGIGGEYGEEIMCLIVVGPMAYATYAAVSKDLAAREETTRKAKEGRGIISAPKEGESHKNAVAGALRTPGADTVTFGVPVA